MCNVLIPICRLTDLQLRIPFLALVQELGVVLVSPGQVVGCHYHPLGEAKKNTIQSCPLLSNQRHVLG
jgi:hypothetical protein